MYLSIMLIAIQKFVYVWRVKRSFWQATPYLAYYLFILIYSSIFFT